TLLPFIGPATSAVIGRSERVDAMSAAFVNAISANLLDFDDTHPETIIHPAGPVAAPVIALAEARKLPGRDVLTAFVLGVEVEWRIGNAIGIAANQSAGNVENLPTAAKNVSVGNAARNGLLAALLAQEGYEA